VGNVPLSSGLSRHRAGQFAGCAAASSGMGVTSSTCVVRDGGHRGRFEDQAFREEAAVAGFPSVVPLDQDRAGEAQKCGRVWEPINEVGAAFDLSLDSFQRVRRPDLPPVSLREAGEREVVAGVIEHIGDHRAGALQHAVTSSNWVGTCSASG
jgi:hypothetical protein